MPRFYFHVHDGRRYTDLQGTEFADPAAARQEASRFAGALLQDCPDQFWNNDDWMIIIEDEQNKTVAELRFSGRHDIDPPSD